jgi:NADP-reducing hydrogenase subunit HndB
MAKLTLDTLRKLRKEQQKTMVKRDSSSKEAHIIIGMGTCGIAAGAKDACSAIIEDLEAKGITNVSVRQTGCMGLCHSEPTVEVIVPSMPAVIYGNVSKAVAKQIVQEHLICKKLLDNHICDRPAGDIIHK